MNRSIKVFVGILTVLFLLYLVGPRTSEIKIVPEVSASTLAGVGSIANVGDYIARNEEARPVKEGNYTQLLWVDSVGKKTKYVLLYLHGFSACPEEGAPVSESIALRYGMNMYAPRLAEHGLIEDEPMINFTGEKYINSAKEALKIARLLGDSVIIMSTSTGSTAALCLASADNAIHSLICYSPNIRVYDKRASLLTGPWGLQVSRLVKGGDYNVWEAPVEARKYWHTKYRLEATIELQRLLESTMNEETFQKVKVPTFIGYYYKNEEEQDNVVSVPAILSMYKDLASEKKQIVVFPNGGNHCMPSPYFGKDIPNLTRETARFLEEVLGLKRTSLSYPTEN